MNKNNNNWPYQEFHNSNKSNSRSNSIWHSRSYEYNNSGKIKKIQLKWGPKTTCNPRSNIDNTSYNCTAQECSSLSIINLSR